MGGDWYQSLSDFGDRVAASAKAGYSNVHESLTELETLVTNGARGGATGGDGDSLISRILYGTGLSGLATATGLSTAAPPPPPPPQSTYDRIVEWLSENRYAVASGAAVIALAGGYAVYVHSQSRGKKRRRAARTGNGARKEVLVLTNYTHHPIAKSLALDLERRGFIVFCVCATAQEKAAVENDGRADVRALLLHDGDEAYAQIEHFGSYLSLPAPAYHGGHTLHLAGIIVGPAPLHSTPTGPLEAVEPEDLSHALDIGIAQPVRVVQLLLPLLRQHRGRFICLQEWILPSLNAPFHGVQCAQAHALRSLCGSLARESQIAVTHVKLGTFDLVHHHPGYAAAFSHSRSAGTHAGASTAGAQNRQARADLLAWPPSLRQAYARAYQRSLSATRRVAGQPMPQPQQSSGPSSGALAGGGGTRSKSAPRGAPIKDLHHAVFDLLTTARTPPREIRCGAGVRTYDLIASTLPHGVVDWLLGCGGRDRDRGLDLSNGDAGAAEPTNRAQAFTTTLAETYQSAADRLSQWKAVVYDRLSTASAGDKAACAARARQSQSPSAPQSNSSSQLHAGVGDSRHSSTTTAVAGSRSGGDASGLSLPTVRNGRQSQSESDADADVDSDASPPELPSKTPSSLSSDNNEPDGRPADLPRHPGPFDGLPRSGDARQPHAQSQSQQQAQQLAQSRPWMEESFMGTSSHATGSGHN